MFIANMFCYGCDPNCVGVDGIVGCMGVFLAHNGTLYAIHVPDTTTKAAGRTAFVSYVTGHDPAFNGANAELFGVLNGPNRGDAFLELAAYNQALNVRKLTVVRLNEHLGPKGLMQDAAAVLCEFIPTTNECRLKYQRHADVNWVAGAGTARAGTYGALPDGRLSANAAPSQGWHLVDSTNSSIIIAH
ncbi:MAG: hypothetical protein R2729_24475 [Bryobacteraceae bacterium]